MINKQVKVFFLPMQTV